MRLAFLAAIALLPSVSAADPVLLTLDLEDARGDVLGFTVPEATRASRPSADILNMSSRIVGDDLRLYVRVAGEPKAPDDSVEARIWFRDSVNGSFDAVDLHLIGGKEPDERLEVLVRRDRFENVTYIPSRYALANGTLWIFSFHASVMEDATCFDPYVRTDNAPKPKDGVQAGDGIGRVEPTCVHGEEPVPEIPPFGGPSLDFPQAEPAPEAPGSRVPGPGLAAVVLLVALLAADSRRRAPPQA